jgi:hypothetical protein
MPYLMPLLLKRHVIWERNNALKKLFVFCTKPLKTVRDAADAFHYSIPYAEE